MCRLILLQNPINLMLVCRVGCMRFILEYKFVHKDISELLNLQNIKGKAKPYQIKQFLNLIEKYKLKMREQNECVAGMGDPFGPSGGSDPFGPTGGGNTSAASPSTASNNDPFAAFSAPSASPVNSNAGVGTGTGRDTRQANADPFGGLSGFS